MRAVAIWSVVIAAMLIPLIVATQSPLLAWRGPIYITAGFAGVMGMALLLIQPLLANGDMVGLSLPKARRVHRLIGVTLVGAVIIHIAGLWITSPPDVIDVLLFRSPTPFGVWGAVAMWGVIATAVLATQRRKVHPRRWRILHLTLAVVIAISTLAHALLIEGTMGTWSKAALAGLVAGATIKTIWDRRPNR